MRTVLQLCQDVLKATGYNPPTAIVSAGSPDSKRLVQLVNEVGLELTSRNKWRRLTFEATVSTSATTTYSLPTDLYEIVNDSMWSRTETEQASGPLNEQEWQMLKGTDAVTELIPEWRLEYTQGVPVLVFLSEPGTQVIYFEYRSTNWLVDTSSSAAASLWTADTQRTLLDEHLFYSELKWRWLKAKGSDYAVDFQNAQVQIQVSRDADKGGSKKLHYGGRF
jgi:hypothetical protein